MTRSQSLNQQMQSRQVVGVFSLCCVATAFAMLSGLAGSSSLDVIQTILRESYRPVRLELFVGDGSILGISAIVLLFAGCAPQFGMFPLHGVVMNGFESSPGGIAGVMAILHRLQTAILLWKVLILAMPGYESTIQLMCVVFGVTSSMCGAVQACRSQSLRGLTANIWMVWGGVALVAIAAGLTAETSAVAETNWKLPTGVENAAFSFSVSVVAVVMLLAGERWLAGEYHTVEFFDELTGLGTQHRLIALAMGCALLTLCAFPPLPGFWCVSFIAGAAFLPGAESTHGPSLVPDALILVSVGLVLISMMVLAARFVNVLSLMFHHEPIRRFQIGSRNLSASISLAVACLLIWCGISAGTVLAWIHQWFS